MKIEYKARARGYVLGNCWGGGTGFYPTKTLAATGCMPENCLKDIEKQAVLDLNDGSLDSGMGFESLLGAVLNVEITAIKIEWENEKSGREWQSWELDEILVVGPLSDAETDFAIDLLNG